MDFLWALLFFLWYEVLTLPLRAALADVPAPADVRRLLSRVAGPLLLVIPIWLAAHAAGAALARPVGLLALALLLALCARPWRAGRPWARLLAYGDRPGWRRRELALEAVTLGVFLSFVVLRRWIPEMTTYVIDSSGAEKFMNMMMFWASWHAPSLPPEDYWLAGHPLTYYYWGHFHWAWIGRLAGFPAVLALNLAFARLVTLVFESSYLLARAVGLRRSVSAFAGVVVTWAGNPSAVGELWRTWQTSRQGYNWAAYNYWKPSRAIADHVIDEFPAFSALLGDFHAHHLALPWVVAWLALLLAGARWLGAPLTGGFGRGHALWAGLWLALGLAAGLTNLWNLPVMAFAMGLLVLYAGWRRGWRPAAALVGLGIVFSVLLLACVRLVLGSDAQPLPVDADAGFLERLPIRLLPAELRSTLGQLFAMWGLPVSVLAAAVVLRAARQRQRAVVAWVVAGGFVLLVSTSTLLAPLSAAALGLWAAVACGFVALAWGPGRWLPRRAAWMGLGACAVLVGVEVLFIDDAYGGKFERYNSYFKLTYPLWGVLWVAAFAAARHLWRLPGHTPGTRALGWVLRVGLVAVLVAGAVYPAFAIPARLLAARRGDAPPRQPTLSAVDFLAHRPPWGEEAPMLAWIREHVPPGDTVAESLETNAQGRDKGAYTYTGRVASLAGRPVPLGWAHHERQWRGRRGHGLTGERTRALDRLYRAGSAEEMRRQAAELGVEWVLFGLVERKRYEEDGGVLETLREAAPLAAAFPPEQPTVFLFDFREESR